jgi:hypothetical protein
MRKKLLAMALSPIMLLFFVSGAHAVDFESFKGILGLRWGDSMETVLKKAYNLGWTPDISVPKEKWGNLSALNFKGKIYGDDKARLSAVFDFDNDDKTEKKLFQVNLTFAKRSVYNDVKDILKSDKALDGYKNRDGWTGGYLWRVGSASVNMGINIKTHEVEILYSYDNDLESTIWLPLKK